MQSLRRFSFGVVLGLAGVLVAAPALAQPIGGDVDLVAPYMDDEPPPNEEGPTSSISLRSLVSECLADVPYLSWETTSQGEVEADQVTITFVNPEGDDLVYAGQPLSGRIIWPGAEADAQGNGINWPGWVFRDGQWIEEDDGFAFTRNNVQLVFQVNPTISQRVLYPPPTADCADAPQTLRVSATQEPIVEVAGVTLARTGTDLVVLSLAGLVLAGAGALLVLRSRRSDP